jgi:hypothetical protein
MTNVEKQIWIQVYSWHMASYQKRHDCDGLCVAGLEKFSEDAMQYATDAIRAFRATQNDWITTETSYMLKELLDEGNTAKPSVGQNQQVPDGHGVVLTAEKVVDPSCMTR